MTTKFIFVTGGVVSSLGKGITAASLGRLLKQRGKKVSIQKFDPYINVDPGTMSPYQHGEVFITEDGAETDLDLGHYERFIDENLSEAASVSSGKVYKTVIDRERRGEYLGATIQIIPHITNEIKKRILQVSRMENPPNVVITEIGGTVGDIESLPFLEAIRQMKEEVGEKNCLYIHVTYLPYIEAAGELKTKPTQHSVKELCAIGIYPDILVCRSQVEISQKDKEKLALFCNLPADQVFQNLTAKSIYEVPLLLHAEGLDDKVCQLLSMREQPIDLAPWEAMVSRMLHTKQDVNIAIVGKYTDLPDAYLSVVEALMHGGIERDCKVHVKWVSAETINDQNIQQILSDVSGILVPGGFGERGLSGKMLAIKYARIQKIPFLGICLGMQMAVIEFARNVLNWRDANTTEADPHSTYPVIDLLADWKSEELGGTMRLGRFDCNLIAGTKTFAAYGTSRIAERHRHRYCFNNRFIDDFMKAGFMIAAKSAEGNIVEIVELKNHPFFIAVQFHPEFLSRPNRPHPLFKSFVEEAIKHSKKQ